ncbi:4Fe-4S dicluster domain-containing protein [Chiayiivirga sp.]|uniref:4Fe-4S dicluster domain-containing protein n=1 Tax=Chiayiivirga sp. TaxID=2041042 RepID=UPI0025C0B0D2|nr:4Fe-4S dicluster domain-containing protein [Chiayiivirga sp.]
MPTPAPRPCIRCGDCVDACPIQLAPLRLHERLNADDLAGAIDYRLQDCTECGRCDAACPSRIALSRQFGMARRELGLRAQLLADAGIARERFEARNARLARAAQEQARDEAARVRTASSADAVQAALARARARRRSGEDAPG